MNDCRWNTTVKTILTIAALIGSSVLVDANITPLYSSGEINVVAIDRAKNDRHAAINCKTEEDQGQFTMVERGEGSSGKYTNIRWEARTIFTLNNGLMQITQSVKQVFNKDGELLETVTKEFDLNAHTAVYRKTAEDGELITERTYPIEGPIVDDINLVHFIRGIYSDGDKRKFESFYLLSNEPKLYKVNTKFIGQETLSLPGGEYEAMKLQLMADLGALTEIAAKVVTPTYVWVSKDHPHHWLQYEGLESGRYSTKVKTYVVKKDKIQ